MLHVQPPVMTLCMPRDVERPVMAQGLLTPARTPPKMPLSFLHDVDTQMIPPTPYLPPQRDSRDPVACSFTLHSEKKHLKREVQRIFGAEDGEAVQRHALQPPDYTLNDLSNTKANNILYREFENRTEKILLQPNVEDHLKRSKQRIKWAQIGGGGTCSKRLIDDLSRRIQCLEQCLKARRALTEGKYAAEVLKSKHTDLVWLEKSIGGFWARPRRVGKEWRYLSPELIEELAKEPEILDGLEEFLVVNDLLHGIVSSTGVCNLLLSESGVQKKRNGYFEDLMMGEYVSYERNVLDENEIVYDADGYPTPKDDTVAPSWIYEPATLKTRSTIVSSFISATLPKPVKEGNLDVRPTSWTSTILDVNLDEEPRPLSFKETDHLAQRAFALKNYLRYLLNSNAVLREKDVDILEAATGGPSGVDIGFRGVRRAGEELQNPWAGHQYPAEINHRGERFDVLREEFKHAIQCWWFLWQKHGKDIKKYLFEGEVAQDGVCGNIVVEEPTLDGDSTATPEGITLGDDYDSDRRKSVDLNSNIEQQLPAGKNDMRFQITSLTTAEVIHDCGEVESFSIDEGDVSVDGFMNNPPSDNHSSANYSSPPPSFTEDQDPTGKPSSPKPRIEEPTAPNPQRRRISYLRKFDIHPSHFDGASRVCPETGETWWADMPPYFMFGETPTMVEMISDQMKEDLRKGKEDLAKDPDFFADGSTVSAVETSAALPAIPENPASGDETVFESNTSPSQDEDMEDAEQASDSGREADSGTESNSDSGQESSDLDSQSGSGDEAEAESKEKVDSFISPGEPHVTSKRNGRTSLNKPTSSLRQTSTALEAESAISNKADLATTTMTTTMTMVPSTSTPYVCNDCESHFHSVEIATFHADETGHFPKHFDIEEHQVVFDELTKGGEEQWDGLEQAKNDEEELDAAAEVGSDGEEPNADEGVVSEEMELDVEGQEELSGDEHEHNEEEKLVYKEIIAANPYKATHSKQSATVSSRHSMPAVKTTVQKTRTVVNSRNNPITSQKTTTVVTTTSNAMAPQTTAYKMAREIAPNDFQCGVMGCDYHDNPRRLSRHVMTHHPGSIKDWTIEDGFKCEWEGCPDRCRLSTGLYQHCIGVHLPPVPEIVSSMNLSKLTTAPRVIARPRRPFQVQHSGGSNARVEKTHAPRRTYSAKGATIVDLNDSDLEEDALAIDENEEDVERVHQEAASTQSSLLDHEDYESANEEPDPERVIVHETVVLKRQNPIVDFDSDSNSNSDSDSDSVTDIPATPESKQITPATAPPVRGGWGSILFSPFAFLSGGRKRKRTDETKKEAAETPVRSVKKVRFDAAAKRGGVQAPRKRDILNERMQEIRRVGR
ncbi:hypothetical protein E2P81_ATG02142 [Venturia nashicola]|nr:hypothetical protein E2P81_ATG02142 [Venturia nashicola]